MPERRYNEDEAAAIFRAATEGTDSGALPGGAGEGLTLRDLQAIGREVDIGPDAIARAARSLEVPQSSAVRRKLLGLPLSVEHCVALPRQLTEAEWELLVVQARQVFNARGTVRGHGSLREWSNGNLHIMLEPTPNGHQVRMVTTKGNARSSLLAGGVSVFAAAMMAATGTAHGSLLSVAPGMLAVGAVGVAVVASGLGRLSSWASERRAQMEEIGARLLDQVQGR